MGFPSSHHSSHKYARLLFLINFVYLNFYTITYQNYTRDILLLFHEFSYNRFSFLSPRNSGIRIIINFKERTKKTSKNDRHYSSKNMNKIDLWAIMTNLNFFFINGLNGSFVMWCFHFGYIAIICFSSFIYLLAYI